jgi:hypothetical protein
MRNISVRRRCWKSKPGKTNHIKKDILSNVSPTGIEKIKM